MENVTVRNMCTKIVLQDSTLPLTVAMQSSIAVLDRSNTVPGIDA